MEKNMKKNRAIVFTVSNDLAFTIACVLMDIKRLSPTLSDDIIVIHDGISHKDQNLLSSILPIKFITYDFPIKDTSIFNQGTLTYFTKMVFSKFECLKLLDEYKNVLLLDYDIILQQDISELFIWCESGIRMMPGGIKVSGNLHEPIDDYNMEAEGICACIFVFQDHLKEYKKMYDFCYASLAKYAKNLYMPEQAIFDFMLQEFNLQISPIDGKVYSPHPTDTENAKNAKIIHSYGQPKFWNGLENQHWNTNYAEWLKIGGSKYKKKFFITRVKNKIINILAKRV